MTTSTKVMIIEDDEGIAEVHNRYLNQIGGYEVVGIATSQTEAEIQLELLQPELVILDVYLPDGNGLEILRQVRQQKQHCDVILVTAARDVDTLQEAMRGGVVDYLLKPVIFSRLEAALKKYQAQKQELETVSDLDQKLVDKMLQSSSQQEPANNRLPKGIDGVTLDKIRHLFVGDTQLTADEAGVRIGASRTTARRYLEYLISSGELEADVHYGSVGRPERTYRKILR
ncbi:putative Transcriptional regulatory protein CitB, DpiA [Vibrio nigripulchritudo SO65]|uniref:response regulator n=1 Tax=Vibrio nigripulchritudo TaxID=28173 RepID=UPI0003B1A937|nr:response regulator [Vibrio nigripulchritudo]CCN36496.1 putative Transcriptional regulatory protein CitB, DpiA [Vibrio nigripulchritudo AM115]CCN43390.1 putative Transcriptional regulatory protein CitB, DpiA [Vibrio nigripulchritudo FTn2]CCN67642.1 putative Transcriptional regulatory protein CitB, DpiA [Vibrio nigripulchritudo POn4]CCN75252.1 putative Transcriptional regulatory protein CitB, DpiA [Vibrio nigripulchritudo SO65]